MISSKNAPRTAPLKLIVYTSQYTGQQRHVDDVLENITQVAKCQNPLFNITGLLFYHRGTFLQILEGAPADLEVLMDNIVRDERNEDVTRLIDEPVESRDFGSWNMDSFNLSDEESLDKDELVRITDAYQKCVLKARTDLIVRFYRLMLKTHELKS